jgi:5,10-methylenetetrahydromethanopterin reductase
LNIIFCASEAERGAFEYISVAESFYRDASVLSSAIANNTTKIKLGSSVYPIPTRTPFQIAMAAATLNEISNDRIGFIGLGVGYRTRIEQYFGLKIKNPILR